MLLDLFCDDFVLNFNAYLFSYSNVFNSLFYYFSIMFYFLRKFVSSICDIFIIFVLFSGFYIIYDDIIIYF